MKIEKNIPMVRNPSKKKGRSKYSFSEMKVKDSFMVPDGKRFSVSTLAKRFGNTQIPRWEFAVHTDLLGHLRCWRVK